MSAAVSSSQITASYTRTTRTLLCPVCGHDSWCSIRSDGAVHCMRIESDQPARSGGGWWHHDKTMAWADPPEYSQSKSSYPETSQPMPTLAPADLDSVYRLILASCSLSSSDSSDLARAGIPTCALGHYGTLPANRRDLYHSLTSSFTAADLAQVPGIGIREGQRPVLRAPAALLVGVCDVDGQIVGLQARIASADGQKSYIWLSSAAMGGPSSGTPAHVAPADNTRIVWITEGVKKADICADRAGCTTIGLPGHALHESGLAVLDVLIQRGALAVVIALDEDSDPATALLVHSSRLQLYTACLARGLAVRVARWDSAVAKGIDDLYLAGQEPTISSVSALLAPEDPGQRKDGRKLTQIEEAARYRCIKRILWNSDTEQRQRSMTPAEKLALLLSYEMTDLYPGTIAAGGCVEPVDLNMGALGRRIGVSATTAGQAVAHLAESGLLIRQARHNQDTGTTTLSVAPARSLGFNEVLPPSQKRQADAARHRCTHCGSDRVLTRHTCLDCGSTWTDEDIVMIISWEQDPTADSATGLIDRELPTPTTESVVGVLPQETDPDLDLGQLPPAEDTAIVVDSAGARRSVRPMLIEGDQRIGVRDAAEGDVAVDADLVAGLWPPHDEAAGARRVGAAVVGPPPAW